MFELLLLLQIILIGYFLMTVLIDMNNLVFSSRCKILSII